MTVFITRQSTASFAIRDIVTAIGGKKGSGLYWNLDRARRIIPFSNIELEIQLHWVSNYEYFENTYFFYPRRCYRHRREEKVWPLLESGWRVTFLPRTNTFRRIRSRYRHGDACNWLARWWHSAHVTECHQRSNRLQASPCRYQTHRSDHGSFVLCTR